MFLYIAYLVEKQLSELC